MFSRNICVFSANTIEFSKYVYSSIHVKRFSYGWLKKCFLKVGLMDLSPLAKRQNSSIIACASIIGLMVFNLTVNFVFRAEYRVSRVFDDGCETI